MDEALQLIVAEVAKAAPLVRSLVLRRPKGGTLPGFEPGAHIRLTLPGVVEARSYSLIELTGLPEAREQPDHYRIGVRLDEMGGGGSRAVHALEVGHRVIASPPRNDFPLADSAGRSVLIAGGIGVTPLLSMAAALKAQGRPVAAHYCGRTRDQLAFAAEFEAVAGPALAIHCDDAAGRLLDIEALFAPLTEGTEHVYVCGPAPMIEAVIAEAGRRGWSPDRVHFELFTAAAPRADDGAFEVELKSTGQVFRIPPDRSILDVLLDAGEDPLYDCKRGDCGICQVAVLEGEPDHRDFILSESERKANGVMQICVSRARSPRLVLDL